MLPRVIGHLHAIKGLGLWDSGKDFHVGALRKRKTTSELKLMPSITYSAAAGTIRTEKQHSNKLPSLGAYK